jgi:hypothetical protein
LRIGRGRKGCKPVIVVVHVEVWARQTFKALRRGPTIQIAAGGLRSRDYETISEALSSNKQVRLSIATRETYRICSARRQAKRLSAEMWVRVVNKRWRVP